MILSYRDKRTRQFADGHIVKAFQSFARQAEKRLEILDAGPTKETLMMLPSNRFEALVGDRKGNSASALTINGASALSGRKTIQTRRTLRSWIITKPKGEIRWHGHQYIPVKFWQMS